MLFFIISIGRKNMKQLSEREKDVLSYIIKGYTNDKIGKELYISKHTAKFHVSTILRKLKSSNRTEAAFWAGKYNLF